MVGNAAALLGTLQFGVGAVLGLLISALRGGTGRPWHSPSSWPQAPRCALLRLILSCFWGGENIAAHASSIRRYHASFRR